jgi:streptogramin lyase
MTLTRRVLATVVCAALVLTAGVRPASAADPDTLSLPDGFQPEGIAIGKTPYAYVGSRVDGEILRIDLHTGDSSVLTDGPGTPALGMKVDNLGRLFVAGGDGGDARVIDTVTGDVLASYQLETGPAFINDVVLTRNAAWFTDSANPVLFELPLGPGGDLPDEAIRVPLSGAVDYQSGINANGIVAAPDGRHLMVVQTNTGKLFRVDRDGQATVVDLGGETLRYGDGMLLRGHLLYVIQNRDDVVTKVKLNRALDQGAVQSRTKDVRFDVPSTMAVWHRKLYVLNARLTTPATSTTRYNVVEIALP